MITLLKTLFIKVLSNKFKLALIEGLAKHSDNEIDDNVVRVVKGAYYGDADEVILGAKGAIEKFKELNK